MELMKYNFAAGVLYFKVLCALNWAKPSTKEIVVFPELVQSREQDGAKILKIHDGLTLSLEKSSVVGEEFLLRTYHGTVMEHKYLDGKALEEDLYHDANSFASVMVSQEYGLQVEGIIGPTLRIKPLPEQERTPGGKVPHLVYEYHDDSVLRDGKDMEVDTAAYNISERQYNVYHDIFIPPKIYPEVLLMADSALREQFCTDEELLRYLLITANSANLRFLSVSEPAVKLKICGLEIFTAEQEVFLERHDGGVVEAFPTMLKLKKHVTWDHYYKYQLYDAVYLVTGLDMVEYGGAEWYRGISGYSFIGGVCGTLKVGFGEDIAETYKGVRILTHEMGHLLGCPHDGYDTAFQNSTDCSWDDGYIMSYVQNNSNSMKFSFCCNREIRKTLRLKDKVCLLKNNVTSIMKNKEYPKQLPGDDLSRDQQCRLSFPNVEGTYFVADEECEDDCRLRCFIPDGTGCNVTSLKTYLADNSPCGLSDNHVCINGECRPKKSHYPVRPVSQ